MTSRTLGIATYERHPGVARDDEPLAAELACLGIAVRPMPWSDFRFDGLSAILVRSVWDYHLRCEAFLEWVARASARLPLCNEASLVRWNAHKGYLRRLPVADLPTIETEWVERGSTTNLAALMDRRGWHDVVVKPAISAGAHETRRISRAEAEGGEEHLSRILAHGDAMVQPFVRAIAENGELSFVFFEGAFSHAVRKASTLEVGMLPMGTGDVFDPAADEVAFARAALDVAPSTPLHARVDLVRGENGRLRVLEIELIEPILFLRLVPSGATRFAEAIARRLG